VPADHHRQGAATGSLRDELRFLRGLLARPRTTGAISPSGTALTRAMANHVDPADGLPVIELGPGTGVVTKALLDRGVDAKRIIAIEYSPEFCRLIRQRFPGVTVIQGDAYDLDRTLGGRADRVSAVVSSLPLVARPLHDRIRLIEAGLARMAPGKPFIQFSYLVKGPVAGVPGRFTAEPSRWIWMNLPPARVWLYRRTA
jgi:phosphatidylethanolamine/phosphatidyl-N-methylethanolamine N-methyltransferase